MRRVRSLGVAFALWGSATPVLAQMEATAATGAASIDARDLRVRVGVLAHDSMAGRDTPSPGLEKAARYVATKFRTFGLRPGAGESYLQRYPITVIRAGPPEEQGLLLRGPDGERALDAASEFVAVPVGDRVAGEGALIRIDAEDETARLAGQIAVLLLTPREMRRAFGRLRPLIDDRGAAGVLLVMDAPADYVAGLRAFFGRRRVSLGEPEPLGAPVALVSASELPARLRASLEEGGALSGWSARMWTTGEVSRTEGMNAVGWLEGSDPELRDEYVFFTAHMDHVGVGRPVNGDSIYNGADDNASGTSTIVELAQAFASADRPRRSLVFMTVSGEEKGLWGSRWYAEHPLFPLDRTVADLNIDMIGRNWEDTVVAIGKHESTLGELVDRVAAEHPELGLTVIDDPWPEERFYFRSDHYNFARRGVPILFFFSGVHEDYHRPTDEPEKLRYEKMARIGRLVYYLGEEIANRPERPRWDEEAYRRVVGGAGR